MRHSKYILFLITLLSVVACTPDEVIESTKNSGNKIRIVSRAVPFNEHNVSTRATDASEFDINTLDYFIVAKKGNTDTYADYVCVYYEHSDNAIISLDRSSIMSNATAAEKEILRNCRIVLLANYPGLHEEFERRFEEDPKDCTTLEDYLKKTLIYNGGSAEGYLTAEVLMTIPSAVEPTLGIPEGGLPRMGDYGRVVNLYDETVDGASNPDIASGATFEVPLQSLYAKMVFDIGVTPTQAGINDNCNKFDLTGFTVYNIPTTIDMNSGTPSARGTINGTEDIVTAFHNPIDGTEWEQSGNEVLFTFYLPERYLRAKSPAHPSVAGYVADTYPFVLDGTIRPEDTVLCQRYKPLLAEGKNATYVKFSGNFVNHQGHSFDVSYDIYVGNDNYSNFDIVRNRQYNNIITIRGIESSSDQSNITDEEGNLIAVSIDHRVNVSRTLPIIINLRRETLLDAHFEVRPMRIRVNTRDDDFNVNGTLSIPDNLAVKVEVVYNDDDFAKNTPSARWIGLERSYGNGVAKSNGYCNGSNNSAHGKRLYFTTDLTTNTLAGAGTLGADGYSTAGGQTVIVPVGLKNGQVIEECVWIYVDECLKASTDPNAIRSAEIHVTNGYIDANKAFQPKEEPIKYTINQHQLFKIVSKKDPNRVYYIEYEEEYLHNFDADDNFTQNQTQFEGMQWGLNGVQLSKTYDAIHVENVPKGAFQEFLEWVSGLWNEDPVDVKAENKVKEKFNPKYDFYILRDISGNDLPDDINKIMYRNYSGWQFNKEIADYILSTYSNHQGENSTDDVVAKINGIRLDEQPKSAFAYCYNRNKRNAKGQVAYQDWYMPSIDELEEIMELAHIQFEDFQGQLYWSCQPAYDKYNASFACYQEKVIWSGFIPTGTEKVYQGNLNIIFFMDDKDRARATRVERENGAFKEVLSSDADILATQNGRLDVSTLNSVSFTLENNVVQNPNFDSNFTNYPGNLPRTGKQCRVRGVRANLTPRTN